MSGFVLLHRKITESAVFDNPDLLRVWIWCLCEAYYTEQVKLIGLQEVVIQAGQFATGRKKAAEKLKLSESTFWRYLKTLEKLDMISIKANNKFSVITVVNWGLYQNKDEILDNKRTANEQQMDTKNKVNKDNNTFSSAQVPDGESSEDENKPPKPKRTYEHDSLFYKAAKWLATDIEQSTPGYKPHSESQLQKWANEARLMMERDKRDPDTTSNLLQFARKDSFWSKNILSMGTFREKYDTLLVRYNEQNGGNEAC